MKEWQIVILQLAGETTVMAELLMEDANLVKMIKDGTPYSQLLDYVNDNW